MNFRRQALSSLMIVGMTTGLIACGGDDKKSSGTNNPPAAQTETIKGVAATGKPFAGKIKVINASGVESSEVTIAADGSYTVTVPKGAPYLIKAYNDQQTLYSYAATVKASSPVNVTQLTTAAIYHSYDELLGDDSRNNLSELYRDWKTIVTADAAELSSMLELNAKITLSNIYGLLREQGFSEADAKKINIFNYPFQAVMGNPFDGMLDDFQLNYACSAQQVCSVEYLVNGASYQWSYEVLDGINIDFNGGGTGVVTGENCLANVTGTVLGQSINSQTCYVNFPVSGACSNNNPAFSGLTATFPSGTVNVSFSKVATCPSSANLIDYATGQVVIKQ